MPKKIESKLINVDLEALKERFNENDTIALGLLHQATFMQKTLKELEDRIETHGTITEMCQGAYSIDRINPALQAYNNTIKNYISVMKQIFEMIPKEDNSEDEFDTFE